MNTWPSRMAITLILIGSTTGCSGDKEKAFTERARKNEKTISVVDDSASGAEREPAVRRAIDPQPAKAVERKVIYTATLKLQVENFATAEEKLSDLVEEFKGILEMSEVTARLGSPRSGHWRIRVAPENLSDFRKAVAKLGEPEQNQLDSQEVTAEFYDVIEDIKSKEKELESYRRLFDQAKGVPDMIAVKRELDRTQQELDRLKGRHKVLLNLTGLTTVHIWLHERGAYVPVESPDFGTSAGRTFSDSLRALTRVGRFLALFAVALVPWLPILLVPVVFLIIWVRRWRRSLNVTPAPLPILEASAPAAEK